MSIIDYCNKAATVIRWTETLNELGVNEMASTYTSISNITVAIQQLSKNEMFVAGADRVVGTHRIYTPITTTITAIDQIIIGANTYDVEGVENPMEMDRHYEIIVRLVK